MNWIAIAVSADRWNICDASNNVIAENVTTEHTSIIIAAPDVASVLYRYIDKDLDLLLEARAALKKAGRLP